MCRLRGIVDRARFSRVAIGSSSTCDGATTRRARRRFTVGRRFTVACESVAFFMNARRQMHIEPSRGSSLGSQPRHSLHRRASRALRAMVSARSTHVRHALRHDGATAGSSVGRARPRLAIGKIKHSAAVCSLRYDECNARRHDEPHDIQQAARAPRRRHDVPLCHDCRRDSSADRERRSSGRRLRRSSPAVADSARAHPRSVAAARSDSDAHPHADARADSSPVLTTRARSKLSRYGAAHARRRARFDRPRARRRRSGDAAVARSSRRPTPLP